MKKCLLLIIMVVQCLMFGGCTHLEGNHSQLSAHNQKSAGTPCINLTNSGRRCSAKTTDPSGYCKRHKGSPKSVDTRQKEY